MKVFFLAVTETCDNSAVLWILKIFFSDQYPDLLNLGPDPTQPAAIVNKQNYFNATYGITTNKLS
jgi:hypothetical protein